MVKTAGPLFGPNVSGPIKRRRRKTYPGANPPAYDLEVTGTLTPDVTGPFHQYGTYNGKPAYKHHSLDWFIWYDWGDFAMNLGWFLTRILGTPTDEFWIKDIMIYEPPAGTYEPKSGAIGTATVAVP